MQNAWKSGGDAVFDQLGAETCAIAGMQIERMRFAGGARTLLYLHPKDGPGEDVAFLEALPFDVHAPWLPGFGRSERPDDFVSLRDLACFVAAYLDDIDARDALIVGASFGGWVAAELATRDASRFAGLILIDTLGFKFGPPDAREIADFHSMKAAEIDARAWVDPARAMAAPDGMSPAAALARARSDEAFALYGWRPYMHDPGLPRWLRRVPTPTLTLWGEADRIVTPEYGRKVADLFPNGRFETIAAAAHYPTREQPAATAASIAAFAETL